MNKAVITLMAAAALPLSACASTNPPDNTLASVGEGAAIGAAGGAGVAALTGGGLLTGAVIGAAVGGLAGAVWADRNNDGVADGYVETGQYYPGAPAGYSASATPSCPSVGGSAAVGAVGGAAVGAGVGALASGISIPVGALIGAAVGGLAGAVWADSNNDGCVDGYISNGQYYSGAPTTTSNTYSSTPPPSTGERG
jgi:hypothetical protein